MFPFKTTEHVWGRERDRDRNINERIIFLFLFFKKQFFFLFRFFLEGIWSQGNVASWKNEFLLRSIITATSLSYFYVCGHTSSSSSLLKKDAPVSVLLFCFTTTTKTFFLRFLAHLRIFLLRFSFFPHFYDLTWNRSSSSSFFNEMLGNWNWRRRKERERESFFVIVSFLVSSTTRNLNFSVFRA